MLRGQTEDMATTNPRFGSVGERAWWAWQCLPRNDRDQPPTWRSLEKKYGMTNATIRRWIWDLNTENPTVKTAAVVATALRCTPEWLVDEEGPGPMTDRHIPRRPAPPKKQPKRPPSGEQPKVRAV